MPMSFFKKVILLFSGLFCILFFQNCSGDFTSTNLNRSEFSDLSSIPADSTQDPVEFEDFGFTIENVEVKNVAADSLLIGWDMSQVGAGKVLYGTSKNELNSQTIEDKSFQFSTHLQPLKNLLPSTKYYFKVQAESRQGLVVESEVLEVTTLAERLPPEVPEEPPAGGGKLLPLSGIFYGTPVGGLQTGNTTTAVEHSVRFRAERTTSLTAVRWENRLLTQGNIDTRSTTKQCRDNKLGPRLCGYTLGNSYHVGNGGKIVATIHPDNGKGLPNESIELGRVRKPYIPMDHPAIEYTRQELIKPVPLQAGKLYHVKLTNLAPPRLPLYRNTVAQAKAKDPNRGAMGFNGIWIGNHVGPENLRWGPFYGRQGVGVFFRNTIGGKWSERTNTIPRLEFLFTDSPTWSGQNHAGYDNISYFGKPVSYRKYGGFKIVQGSLTVRQQFKVESADRIVNGMWLNYSHTENAALTPMTVELKNAKGEVLATGSIQASATARSETRNGKATNNLGTYNSKVWQYTNLNKETSLKVGQTYYLEMKAGANAGFIVSSFFPHTRGQNDWLNAHAQVNFGKGAGWERYDKHNGWADRDLPILFTLKGMPKQLP